MSRTTPSAEPLNIILKSLKTDVGADTIPEGAITVVVSRRHVVDTDTVAIGSSVG